MNLNRNAGDIAAEQATANLQHDAYLAALHHERAGYEAKGRPERAKAVTAEIARARAAGPPQVAQDPPRDRQTRRRPTLSS